VRIIGVISDTHGLLREEAAAALEGSDLILHAGDVGDRKILDGLARIAPVRAVRGNTDWGELAAALPVTEVVDLSVPGGGSPGRTAGPVAYLIHVLEDIDLDPAAAGFAVVVHGHTHEPAMTRRDGVLFFNPGAAGPTRLRLPVSVGRLTVDGARIDAEIIHLEPGA
jgi:putative phosphoesterase